MTKKNKKVIIILSAVLAVCLVFTGLTFSKSFTGKLFGGMKIDGGEPLSDHPGGHGRSGGQQAAGQHRLYPPDGGSS